MSQLVSMRRGGLAGGHARGEPAGCAGRAQQLEGAFKEGEAALGAMLPGLAADLLRSMPGELRRLLPRFPPLGGAW